MLSVPIELRRSAGPAPSPYPRRGPAPRFQAAGRWDQAPPGAIGKTFRGAMVMSVLPAKAEICGAKRNVCFGNSGHRPNSLIDHFVGGEQQLRRNGQAERLGSP